MQGFPAHGLALLLVVLFSADWGSAGSRDPLKPTRSTCLDDALFAGDGRVVIYDTVVSVPQQRLYLIGPHQKLWVVKEMPEKYRHTVKFSSFFRRGFNASAVGGSFCSFSADGVDVGESLLAFMEDPLQNVNIAYCSLTDAAMDALMTGGDVATSVTLAPNDQAVASMLLPSLPLCVPEIREPVYASMCCIIKNEGRYLREWIEYSMLVGVERFFLYDHASSDDTRAVLAPYVQSGTVVLHNWSFPGYPQREAHQHCTHRYAHQTSW
jgi:hypothetical protein